MAKTGARDAKTKQQEPEPELSAAEVGMKRIAALNKAVDKAEIDLQEAEAHVRVCRQAKDRLIAQLRRAISEEQTPNLFSPGIVVTDADVVAARADAERKAAEADAKPKPAARAAGVVDAWRDDPVDLLDIKDGVKAALKANAPPLDTLGALSDWKAAGKSYADVPGMTAAAAKLVEKAVSRHFQAKAETKPAEGK